MTESTETTDDATLPFSREVGHRLRAVRRQRRLSLDDVERQSGGRWSASAIGAYERGFRNLSLPRLRELAEFFSVPMATLLGEIDLRDDAVRGPSKVVLDLGRLEQLDEAAPLVRYARSIVLERGDWNGRMLSIRKDDVRALGSMLHLDDASLLDQLERWGVLVSPGATIDLTDSSVAAL